MQLGYLRDGILKNASVQEMTLRLRPVLSINNLYLLYVITEIDSNGREGLSVGKFSLKYENEDPLLKSDKTI